jgi:phosphohistidine swiveling domain-containing protein
MSFLMHGLRGKGWAPAVDFWFDNQIVVGVPGKGTYIFYDKNQLSSEGKYQDIQESIDNNSNFVADFKRRSDEVFGAVFFKCLNIELENLSLLAQTELIEMYQDFMQTIMASPLITVQLWGIEACLEDNYRIATFLRDRLQVLGKNREYDNYRGILSVNTGETVTFTEQKNFYQVAERLWQHPEVAELFRTESVEGVSKRLKNFPEENQLFEQHTKKYEWVHTEYVSGGWSREQWIELFQQTIKGGVNPTEKLTELLDNFEELNRERSKVIAELNPPVEVRHALDSLAILIASRDWAKGYFTRILLHYTKLLDEIARRLDVTRDDLLYYSYQEIEEALKNNQAIAPEEITSRKQDGFVIVIKHGELSLVTGKENVADTIQDEGINEPFENLINIKEFKGIAASKGRIIAKARVLEDASRIEELEEGEILVTYMTTIEFIPAFRKAGGVITDEGGLSCHAAIISREFKLPCVVGTKVATRVIQTGNLIELDASQGIVRILAN